MRRARGFPVLGTFLALALSGVSCTRRNASPSTAPSPQHDANAAETSSEDDTTLLKLPMGFEDVAFAERWKSQLAQSSDPELGFTVRSEALDPRWKMPVENWLNESGSVYRLALKAGSGTQDLRTWLRLLQDAQALIESPQPALPWRSSTRFFSNLRLLPGPSTGAPLNRYVEIQTAPGASPLAKEACEVLRRWFSARQLLAGRNLRALSRTKESLTLHCSLDVWTETPPTMPYLQVAELPLPILEPERQELLFRAWSDLERLEKIRTLQRMPDASRQN